MDLGHNSLYFVSAMVKYLLEGKCEPKQNQSPSLWVYSPTTQVHASKYTNPFISHAETKYRFIFIRVRRERLESAVSLGELNNKISFSHLLSHTHACIFTLSFTLSHFLSTTR